MKRAVIEGETALTFRLDEAGQRIDIKERTIQKLVEDYGEAVYHILRALPDKELLVLYDEKFNHFI